MSKRKGRSRARPSKPFVPLGSVEVAALNRAFYAAEPSGYFQLRLRRLVQFGATTDGEERTHEQTYYFGKLEMTVPSVDEDPPDEDGHQSFLAIEAEMLVHHVAETVLRMFVAHRSGPASPWVEISKMRGLGEFKRAVEQIASPTEESALQADVGYVWAGARKPSETQPDLWQAVVERLVPYIQAFGRVFLDRAPLYNAAKHGLAVPPGDRKMSLAGIPELTATGPSLAWLAQEAKDEHLYWIVKNRWLKPELDFAYVHAGIQMLRGLWAIARSRYVTWPLPEQIPLPPELDALIEAATEGQGILVQEVAMPPGMFSPPGSGADARRPQS